MCTCSGGTRGIQSQYQPGKQLPEEDAASECAVAPVWLPLLLLHIGLQFVACHLPQQEGEIHIHPYVHLSKSQINERFRKNVDFWEGKKIVI